MNSPVLNSLLDLLRLVRLIRSSPARLLKNGLPGKRVLQSINDQFVVPDSFETIPAFEDSGYVLFLYELAYQLELIEERQGTIFWNPTECERFFAMSQQEQRQELLSTWLTLVHWNEMRRVPSLEVRELEQPSTPLWTARRLVRARKHTLKSLASTLQEPLSLADAVAALLEANPDVLSLQEENPEEPYSRLWWMTEDDEHSLQFPEDQVQVEGEFFRILLTESLVWLGEVRLQGDMVIPVVQESVSEAPSPPPMPPFLVQPNLTILAFPAPGLLSELFRLEKFAQPMSGDQILQYKLNEVSFLEALQQGETAEGILAYLEQSSRVPLPQNVRQLLLTWYQQSNQLVVSEDGTILEASSPEELQEVMESLPSAISWIQLDDTRLFLRSGAQKELQAWSKTVPVIEIDYNRPPPRCLNIDADLSVRLDLLRADLYARPFLEQIATRQPSQQSQQEVWQIQRDALQQTMDEGLSPAELFGFLDLRAHIFSSTARFRLEAYCGLVGEVFAGAAEIVLTPDAETMERLLYEGGLRRFATRLGPAAAWIRQEALTEAYALLETYALPTTQTPPSWEESPDSSGDDS